MTRLALVLAALLLATGCQAISAEPDLPTPVTAPPVPVAEATKLLDALTVKNEDTGAHYVRADWLDDWAYDPVSKCNTRERVLIRDGDGEVVDSKCRATCPRAKEEPACWISLYDGRSVYTITELQIDHIVSLREATRSGSRGWTKEQRKAFANDMDNLVAVSSSSNGRKGADDVHRGRPERRDSWCRVAATTVVIKSRYALTIDQDEREALAAMLRTCAA